MKNDRLVLVGLGAAGALTLALISAKRGPAPKIIRSVAPSSPIVRRRRRGALVGFTYKLVPYTNKRTGKTGTYKDVLGTPKSLKAAAEETLGKSMSDEVFVLGTVLASEAGSMPVVAKAGIAHAVLNAARKTRKNILRLVIPNGVFGSQGFNGRGYAATTHPPTAEDVEIANAVLKGLITDPTGGAVQWDAPRVQRKGYDEGWPGYNKTPEMVAAERVRSGKEEVVLPGIDPEALRFWRPRQASA